MQAGWPRWSNHLVPLQPLDIGVTQAEMMADLMDQHIAHQAEQLLAGFNPFQQNGFAIEKNRVGLLRHIQH
jgi:hypothetical protein